MYVPAHYKPSTPIGLLIRESGGGNCDSKSIEMTHLADFDMGKTILGRSYPRPETDLSNYILVTIMPPCGSLLPVDTASRFNVPSMKAYLEDTITHISRRYNIDTNRVVLAGFSMGGI